SPDIAEIRKNYQAARLRRAELQSDPIAQFYRWLDDAFRAAVVEPTAMSLATAWSDGRPLVRTVLLKGADSRGFVFYTNLESRKARQLSENPHASVLFPWLALERQVIVTGPISRLPAVDVDKYFATRPRASQLAAWASPQSSRISSREFLELEWERAKQKFGEGKVPLPSFWGGFRIKPETIEFWQGGPNRLHDRFEYTLQLDSSWAIARLAP
ncbi:MAG TPA: pyridoxamine 5'-phosphate oxidase, partial [Terrimicrobiaceae bacterium]